MHSRAPKLFFSFLFFINIFLQFFSGEILDQSDPFYPSFDYLNQSTPWVPPAWANVEISTALFVVNQL